MSPTDGPTATFEQHDWENPHVLGINKLPYHVTLEMPSKERVREDIKQFELFPYAEKVTLGADKAPKYSKKNGEIVINAGNSTFTIDKTGGLASWKVDDSELLDGALEPYFGKPWNDNQSQNRYYMKTMSMWEDQGANRQVKNIKVDKFSDRVKVTAQMSLPAGADYTLTYTIDGDGRMLVDADYHPLNDTLPLMPKFGIRMRLPAEMTRIEYLGRGPWENYPDRKRGYFVGRYAMPLSEYQHDYIHPQDNGNRSDISWLTFSPATGGNLPVIRIEGKGAPLNIRAWDYDENALREARHPHELKHGDFVNVNIDHAIHGVGGVDTCGSSTLQQYTVRGNEPHHYSFSLTAE